jgi:hypothetical protein
MKSISTTAARWRAVKDARARTTTSCSSIRVIESSVRVRPNARLAQAPIADAMNEGVHGGSVEVAGRVVHLRDAIPSLVHGQEGVLRELLRLEPVTGHQTERLEQPLLLTLEEGLELQDPFVGEKGRLHGL